MAGHQERQVPWFGLSMAFGALVCHSLVLSGNLLMVSTLDELSESTGGWADVGLGLSHTLRGVTDAKLRDVALGMTEAASAILAARAAVDGLLLAAPQSSPAEFQLDLGPRLQLREDLNASAGSAATAAGHSRTAALEHLRSLTQQIVAKLRPVLHQVQRWLTTFGDHAQAGIELFASTLDFVQGLVDQLMVQLRGPGENEEVMLHHAFNLFDVSNTGAITAGDMQDVARIFQISTLDTTHVQAMITRYDWDGDQQLSKEEFRLLARDSSLPALLPSVLRAYARRLQTVSAAVDAARTRSEVARAVSQYIATVCIKNQTKTMWLAQALTNSSLPLEFSASILAHVALPSTGLDGPQAGEELGGRLVAALLAASQDGAAQALHKVTEVDFWIAEGLDPAEQADAVQRLTIWAASAAAGGGVTPSASLAFVAVALGLQQPEHRQAPQAPNASAESRPLHSKTQQWQEDEDEDEEEQDDGDGDQSVLLQSCSGVLHGKAASGVQPSEGCLSPRLDHTSLLQLEGHVRTLKVDGARGPSSMATNAPDSGRPPRTPAAPSAATIAAAARHAAEGRLLEHRAASRRALQCHGASPRLFEVQSDARSYDAAALGRRAAAMRRWRAGGDEAERAVNAGVPAAAETLRFAAWLSANASGTARMLQHECFVYTSQAGTATESVATQVAAVVKKVQSVLNVLRDFSTPQGVSNLEALAERFLHALQAAPSTSGGTGTSLGSFVEEEQLHGTIASESDGDLRQLPPNWNATLEAVAGAWLDFSPVLEGLLGLLPTSIEVLASSRSEVAAAATAIETQFSAFRPVAPPLIARTAQLYKQVWLANFAVFVVLTLLMPAYEYWASGHIVGGKMAAEDGEEEEGHHDVESASWREKLFSCHRSCLACMTQECTGHLAGWSVLLLMELLWLLVLVSLLAVSLVVCLRAFLAYGCLPAHILNDGIVCSQALTSMADWLEQATWAAGEPAHLVCSSRNLLTCRSLTNHLGTFAWLTMGGSFAGTVFSLNLLADAASKYERSRYSAALDAEEQPAKPQ